MMRMLVLVIFIISIVLNMALIYVLVLSERMNHSIEIALGKRGIIKMDEKHRPDYWMLQGWTNSIAKQHTQYDVAFIGNSLTYNSDFQKYFPDLKIINLGVSGNTLRDMQRRIPTLVATQPRKVFVMAGANDLLSISIEEYVHDYELFLLIIKSSLPETEIYVQSILPMNSSAGHKQVAANDIIEANKRITELATKQGVAYIDLYSSYVVDNMLPAKYSIDGLHLKDDAYSIWAMAIHNYINH